MKLSLKRINGVWILSDGSGVISGAKNLKAMLYRGVLIHKQKGNDQIEAK